MTISQFEIWLADLNPRIGTEAGKRRPVVILQTNLLNHIPHPWAIVCPLSTNIKSGVEILRVRLKKGESNLNQDCEIMIDQIRAIDNQRLIKKLGKLPVTLISKVKENVKICLDLE